MKKAMSFLLPILFLFSCSHTQHTVKCDSEEMRLVKAEVNLNLPYSIRCDMKDYDRNGVCDFVITDYDPGKYKGAELDVARMILKSVSRALYRHYVSVDKVFVCKKNTNHCELYSYCDTIKDCYQFYNSPKKLNDCLDRGIFQARGSFHQISSSREIYKN